MATINFLPNKRRPAVLNRVIGIGISVLMALNMSLVSAAPARMPADTDPGIGSGGQGGVTPVANPWLTQSCGLDIGLVIDRSGSTDTDEMSKQKTALINFANDFVGTPTVFSLTSFTTNSTLEEPFAMTPAQAAAAIAADITNDSDGNTNWESGLARSFASFDPRPAKSNLIVIATDGSPNRHGYPTATAESLNWTTGISAAVTQANLIKTAGTRIVVVGIGEDMADPATADEKLKKMKDISGPSVATTPAAITTSTDVIKVSDFNGIGDALAAFADQLCGGKILVQKQFDTNGDGVADIDGSTQNALLSGYQFQIDGSVANVTPLTTDTTGALSFNVVNGTYSVVESNVALQTSLVSAQCQIGTQPIGTVNLNSRTVSNLIMTADQTITCTFVNAPANGTLHVVKQVVGSNVPASSWSIHVARNTVEVAGSPQPGSAAGVDFSLPPGDYTISESGPAGYALSFSQTCLESRVTVVAGQTTTCTLTNALVASTIINLDKTGPATVIPGNSLTYALAWSIGGNTPATETVLTDSIPANTTFVSADQGGVVNDGVVSWNLGTRNPGEEGVVTLVVKSLSPLANDSAISNTATLDSAQTEPVSDTVLTTVTSQTSLSIKKTLKNQLFVNPGGVVTYTVVVTNAAIATNRANDVIMTDTLPNGFLFVDGGGSTKTYTLGHIMPGTSVTRDYDVRVAATQEVGVYTNTVKAKGSNTPEVIATANIEVRLGAVLGSEAAPKLTIKKSISQPTAKRGDVATYTLTVANIGDANATNATVEDTLPAGLSFVDRPERTRTWELATVNAETALTFSYDVRVDTDAARGAHVNRASIRSDGQAKVETTATLDVLVPQVLGLATTGSSLLDYSIMAFGSALVALGIIGFKRRNLARELLPVPSKR